MAGKEDAGQRHDRKGQPHDGETMVDQPQRQRGTRKQRRRLHEFWQD
jgi:hypothetical protein